MHAIVRQGDGKYYVSPVFGYYGEHLIKWFAMQPNTKYLIPQILIVESSQEN